MIRPGDFDDPQVRELLRLHLAGMHDSSPPGTVYALDLSGLLRPDIALYTLWERDVLLGCGALRELSTEAGEIKSMRTHPAHLRKGVAKRLLDHIVGVARARGYHTLSLETGSGPAFEAATIMYRSAGFREGEPFGDYTPSEFNRFSHLSL